MIHDFDDFCLWTYTLVDDIWQEISWLFKRPGPKPECSDSELITIALIGESCGWDKETELLSRMREHQDLFKTIPTQSRFNRRRRQLMKGFNLLRQIILRSLDVAQEHRAVIDSLPVPVVQFHLATGSSREWAAYGASYGKITSKQQTIYGFKLHLLVTVGGVILDFELASAHLTDVDVGFELLSAHTDLDVVGDKAYISATKAEALWLDNRIRLRTLPRRNQQHQLSDAARKAINTTRQIIETVNGQLAAQFNIQTNQAHTFWGLCTRLYTKLTAHTLCIYLNRLMGKADFLQIKALAFPI